MANPDYQTLMLPILEHLADGQTRRTVPDITDYVAKRFGLTPDDLAERVPSGVQSVFYNRTHWAVTYLAKARLVTRPARGRVAITERGQSLLTTQPARVDVALLRQYP